jgi:hypothetical protein
MTSSWLSFEPAKGVIKGGEKTHIQFKLQITQREA